MVKRREHRNPTVGASHTDRQKLLLAAPTGHGADVDAVVLRARALLKYRSAAQLRGLAGVLEWIIRPPQGMKEAALVVPAEGPASGFGSVAALRINVTDPPHCLT